MALLVFDACAFIALTEKEKGADVLAVNRAGQTTADIDVPVLDDAIVEADAVVKGQSASSSYKPAKLENGLRVMVPPFIESGTRIVVSTEDVTYVKRAE